MQLLFHMHSGATLVANRVKKYTVKSNVVSGKMTSIEVEYLDDAYKHSQPLFKSLDLERVEGITFVPEMDDGEVEVTN